MSHGQTTVEAGRSVRGFLDGPFKLVVVLGVALLVLTAIRLVAGVGTTAERPSTGYPLPEARPAPSLELTGPDARPLSLAGLHGMPVFVFFGYTHCPDVCPATLGTVGLAIDAYARPARAIFVTVDPERDTVAWLSDFVRFLPTGFTAATGSLGEIRRAADAWGVRYARVEEADSKNYSMAHTADVSLVDADGWLRATFPFGTDAPTMTAAMRAVAADPLGPVPPAPTLQIVPSSAPASVTPTPNPTPTEVVSATDVWPRVISSSIWAGGPSPVILALYEDSGARLDDPNLTVTVQVVDPDGALKGQPVLAPPVQPPGLTDISFVPTINLPSPGRWTLHLDVASPDGTIRQGSVDVMALAQGGTAALGAPAPAIRTPTVADVAGDLRRLTTDPVPDPRLLSISTADALVEHSPFVLVVDSVRFKVTRSCGQAEYLARRLVDRWVSVPFIYHEPYRYSIVAGQPVIDGSLADPRLTDAAEAWGVGSAPWGVRSMPWVFLVDRSGIVRAKYQGVIGTADVDVLLTLLTADAQD